MIDCGTGPWHELGGEYDESHRAADAALNE